MAGPIRQPIDLDALSSYIGHNVPGITLPIDVKQFGFGQSNPTYQLTAADGIRYVMRKKPPGKLLSKTAHQVEREYKIIHALGATNVPVPKTYILCEDTGVIGTAFYIMEFLDGRIFEDAAFPGVSSNDRSEMWHDAIRTIAKLHSVNPDAVGLADFGRSSGFYNRQIKTLSAISSSQSQAVDVETKQKVGDIPHFQDMVRLFKEPRTQPKDRTSLVHGDYKIDNLVYHKTEPRVIGILDWEMSTIGHPLSDLSNLFHPFTFAAARSSTFTYISGTPLESFAPGNKTAGLPSHAQLMQWYAESAGWDPAPESKWGDAFGVFRNSVIMQGIAARYALRQASSAKAKDHATKMGPFGEFAWGLIKQAKEEGASHGKLKL